MLEVPLNSGTVVVGFGKGCFENVPQIESVGDRKLLYTLEGSSTSITLDGTLMTVGEAYRAKLAAAPGLKIAYHSMSEVPGAPDDFRLTRAFSPKFTKEVT